MLGLGFKPLKPFALGGFALPRWLLQSSLKLARRDTA
jgi:hypothetical protein